MIEWLIFQRVYSQFPTSFHFLYTTTQSQFTEASQFISGYAHYHLRADSLPLTAEISNARETNVVHIDAAAGNRINLIVVAVAQGLGTGRPLALLKRLQIME